MNIFPFSTIDKNLLSEKIAAQILLLIKERQLKPGEKLPPEREVAAILQVSRSALREAFRSLAMVGAIDSRQVNGTYVTSLEPELLFDQLEYVVSQRTVLLLKQPLLQAHSQGFSRGMAEVMESVCSTVWEHQNTTKGDRAK
jgi:DNA-binding transcriptional regulator YhcF (GntR family)